MLMDFQYGDLGKTEDKYNVSRGSGVRNLGKFYLSASRRLPRS